MFIRMLIEGTILTRIGGLMSLLALLTLVACCLSVAGVLAAAVLERRSEVALLRAIGAHWGDVWWLFLSEAGILGMAGGVLAAATGPLLGQWLVNAVFGSRAEPGVMKIRHFGEIFPSRKSIRCGLINHRLS